MERQKCRKLADFVVLFFQCKAYISSMFFLNNNAQFEGSMEFEIFCFEIE